MGERKKLPMRLAMRLEGSAWNAYVAKLDTMEGAIWVGSIAARFIEDKRRKEVFLELMKDALSEVFEEMTRTPVTWNKPVDAPEHEKTRV